MITMIIGKFVRSYDKQDVLQEVTPDPETIFKTVGRKECRKNSVGTAFEKFNCGLFFLIFGF